MDSMLIVYACIIVVLVICLANDGDKKAEKALVMLEDYDKFLTTNLIGVNVVNIASSTIATVMFVAIFADLGSVVNIVVMTLVSLTFCEIIPKSVAKKNPVKWCIKTVNIFAVLVKILSPVSWLFTKLTKAIGETDDETMSDEELEVLIDECEEGGSLDTDASELIKSAIRFDDIEVGTLCVPRMDVTAVNQDATSKELSDILAESGFSRIPVYRKTIDDIVGVVYSKDYFTRAHKGLPCNIASIMKPVKYVPESMTASTSPRA